MLDQLKKRITIITGHYGCGKTNLAINLAVDCRSKGEGVSVIDLDIVNPYFRSADFTRMLTENGVDIVAPNYANTLLDVPSLPREVSTVLQGDGRVIVDVGGDDVGATVLGRYEADIRKAGGADLLYLFSIFRPGAESPEEIVNHIRAIESASRQKATYLVNSSNLGAETKKEHVERSAAFAKKVVELTGIPLLATIALKDFSKEIPGSYPVKRFVRLPWEPEEIL